MHEMVGNQGSVNSLFEWLKDWDDVHVKGNKKKQTANFKFNRGGANPWASMPNINAKAALLSGPPGIGKTSSVRIVCKMLGYEVFELNASDCRSKLGISSALGTIVGN